MNFLNWIKSIFAKNTVVETVSYDGPTDILGNELQPGDFVVRVKYNDLARRGYFTIAKDHDVLSFNDAMRFKVVKYDALSQMTTTDGRKHGYLHVAAC